MRIETCLNSGFFPNISNAKNQADSQPITSVDYRHTKPFLNINEGLYTPLIMSVVVN